MADAETRSDMDIFLSMEAIIMFPIAIILDLVGIILVCFGLDDFYTTDIIAVSTIGFWMLFRSQMKTKPSEQKVEMPEFGKKRKLAKEMKQTRKATKTTKKATKMAKWGKRLKWVRPLCFLGEFINWFGALPFLTVATYLELKYNS